MGRALVHLQSEGEKIWKPGPGWAPPARASLLILLERPTGAADISLKRINESWFSSAYSFDLISFWNREEGKKELNWRGVEVRQKGQTRKCLCCGGHRQDPRPLIITPGCYCLLAIVLFVLASHFRFSPWYNKSPSSLPSSPYWQANVIHVWLTSSAPECKSMIYKSIPLVYLKLFLCVLCIC